jgi:tetratricopeptide (TPR) repeat protein
VYALPQSTPFHLLVRGQPLAAQVRERTLKRNIDRLIRREIGSKELMRLLVNEVVYLEVEWHRWKQGASDVDATAAVEFNHRAQLNMMFAAAPSDTMMTFTYFEPGYAEFLQYGALADFIEAIRLKPHYPDPYYNRALIEEQRGDFPSAIADYRNYLKFGIGKPPADLSAVMDKVVELKKKR